MARKLVGVILPIRTFYGVTSERVVIVSGLLASHVKSVNLDLLSELSLSERERIRNDHARARAVVLVAAWRSRLAWVWPLPRSDDRIGK